MCFRVFSITKSQTLVAATLCSVQLLPLWCAWHNGSSGSSSNAVLLPRMCQHWPKVTLVRNFECQIKIKAWLFLRVHLHWHQRPLLILKSTQDSTYIFLCFWNVLDSQHVKANEGCIAKKQNCFRGAALVKNTI